MITNKTCYICGQIAGDPDRDLIYQLARDAEYICRVATVGHCFAVIPSLGPITPGHALLCPRFHVMSFAEMPSELCDEYDSMKRQVSASLGVIYEKPVHCFEHGSSERSAGPICSVGHAHLHLLPTHVDVTAVLTSAHEWIHVRPVLSDVQRVVAGREYLYYEEPDGSAMVAVCEEKGFESQYLRRVFAAAIGRPEKWNWREDPDLTEVERAFLNLRDINQNINY